MAPLYQLLKYYRGEKWQLSSSDLVSSLPCEDRIMPLISLDYIQQLILMNLERLATTVLSNTNPDHEVRKRPLSPREYLVWFFSIVRFRCPLFFFHRFCQSSASLSQSAPSYLLLNTFLVDMSGSLCVCQIVFLQFSAVDDLDLWA